MHVCIVSVCGGIADHGGADLVDGVVDPEEFRQLLGLSGFKFTPDQISEMCDAADVNHDGVIEYEEFIPVGISLLQR